MCNYAFLEGYDYKKISKLPTDIDERKYLDSLTNSDVVLDGITNKNTADATDKATSITKTELLSDYGKSSEINANLIKEENEDEHSEVIGVRKGEIFNASPTKVSNKNWDKDPKIEPKNSVNNANTGKTGSTISNTKKGNTAVSGAGTKKTGGAGTTSNKGNVGIGGAKKNVTTKQTATKTGVRPTGKK